ncbi:MAG: ADP-ribosylglycohydrolase family protein [Tidjanibacter sp.]|nr:ADP-ribosylglycohydrolase family protein [Tidjanibacter sp.]
MKKTCLILLFALSVPNLWAQKKTIDFDTLRDKIAGAWIGQMVGNFYGLPYENKFIDEAGGEENWPWGYAKSLTKLDTYDGAFSDDDTDFEYLYLALMEKCGVEPTYAQIRDAWVYHVRDRVWLANRAAVGLMNYGYTPPFTGSRESNPHWFQIDPQLINEIWAYTAPGMADYAAEKSAWAARVTSDDWAVSPTVVYGAIYANAFFEKDIKKLITTALNYLPEGDRYAQTVRRMIALYEEYPNDWLAARNAMCKEYYIDEPASTKTIWNANLNGACGILALLYGGGDWQRTMDIGISMGFDADNQTATLGGILGVLYGTKKIPDTFLNPFGRWDKPFNNQYVNITRYDMPDGRIDDMIERTFQQAVKLSVLKGGKVTTRRGKQYLTVNSKAAFNAPMEFCVGPAARIEVGKYIDYSFACAANKDYRWQLTGGALPEGILFDNGQLSGTTTRKGKYDITLSLSDGKTTIEQPFTLMVRGRNIAPEADSILTNVREVNKDVLFKSWITIPTPQYADNVGVINDGILGGEGQTFYSLAAESNLPKIDYFGYEWTQPHTIDMIAFHRGCLEEFGGWLSSINIQYRGADGGWYDVGAFTSTPELPKSDVVFIQPHSVEYLFEFAPVTTTAIRMLGDTKIQEHWNKATKNTSSFTSITELSVYEK